MLLRTEIKDLKLLPFCKDWYNEAPQRASQDLISNLKQGRGPKKMFKKKKLPLEIVYPEHQLFSSHLLVDQSLATSPYWNSGTNKTISIQLE